MAFTVNISDTLDIRGTLNVSSGTITFKDDQVPRTKLARSDLAEYPAPLTNARVWDAVGSLLPSTAASDDLAIITGTWATNAPTLRTSDAKATTVTQRAFLAVPIPPQYISGETLTVRIRAGMVTTISDSTATVDLEAYIPNGDGAVGSDLCATAAQSINSLTKADKDFTITPSGLDQADLLLLRITVAITDSATATAVLGEISSVSVLADIR